jgi:hypothetical protein
VRVSGRGWEPVSVIGKGDGSRGRDVSQTAEASSLNNRSAGYRRKARRLKK